MQASQLCPHVDEEFDEIIIRFHAHRFVFELVDDRIEKIRRPDRDVPGFIDAALTAGITLTFVWWVVLLELGIIERLGAASEHPYESEVGTEGHNRSWLGIVLGAIEHGDATRCHEPLPCPDEVACAHDPQEG